MKQIIILLIAVVLTLGITSCTSEDKEMVEESIDTAVHLPDRTKTVSDLAQLRSAVKMYYLDKNMKYPETLDVLKLKLYYSTDEYEYDNSNGNVKSKHYKNL